MDSEIKEAGLCSAELIGLGGTKKHNFFFTSTSCFMLSFSDPHLRISVLKQIKIQTSRLTSQRLSSPASKARWCQWCGYTQSVFSLISWCHQKVSELWGSYSLSRYIREEAYELFLQLTCESVAYEDIDGAIGTCSPVMLRRLLVWELPKCPLTATEMSKWIFVGY